MPNFAISDMAPITLPIDPANTFFETETIEGGISVSRKVSGSELGIGGSVISVVGGLNINVDATDPLNPIVNLDASIAPVDVNGVTLSNAGAATNYLDETGAYSVPPAAGGPPFDNISFSGNDIISVDANGNINLVPNGNGVPTMWMFGFRLFALDFNYGYAATYGYNNGTQIAAPTADSQLVFMSGDANDLAAVGFNEVDENFYVENRIRGGDIYLTAARAADGVPVTCAVANGDGGLTAYWLGNSVMRTVLASSGGLEVNNTATGAGFERVLTTSDAGGGGQVDSIVAGTAITVNAGDPVNPTVNFDTTAPLTFFAQMQFQNAVRLRYTTAAADSPGVGQIHASADDIFFVDDNGVSTSMIAAGAIPDPLIIGSINLTSALSAATLGAPYTNVPINIGGNLTGTQGMTQLSRQRIQTKPSAFSFNSTLFINTDGAGTSGSNTFIGGLNSASIEVEFGVAVRMQHGTVSTVVAETAAPAAGGFLVNNTLTGGGLERVLTLGDLGGGGIAATPTPASGQVAVWDSTGATLAGQPALFYTGAQFRVNSGFGGATLDLRDGSTSGIGADVGINFTDSAGAVQAYVGTASISDILLIQSQGGQVSVVAGTGGTSKVTFDALSLQLEEKAAPGSNTAGYGQYWVRSSAPCRPEFRDDTDVNQLLDPSISEIVSTGVSRVCILTDKGKTIGFTGGTAAQTMTIPANASVAYQIGTVIAFDNSGSVSISIAITTDTLIFADSNGTGTRVLAAGGYAAAQKVGATTWKISGANIS